MRILGTNVKQLAPSPLLWHGTRMKSNKPASKEDRLAEALRANLRRRKAPKAGVSQTEAAQYDAANLDTLQKGGD